MKASGQKQIAERYVRALFDAAEGVRDEVEKDLAMLAGMLKASEDFQRFLGNPLMTRSQQAKIMAAILSDMKAHKLTQKFIAVLAGERRLTALPGITLLFIEWARAARGEMAAELIAPTPLSVSVVDKVALRLGKASGKKMILSMRHDPTLLGGVIVRIGSLQLDSSLAGKLARLGRKLKAA